MILPDVNVLLAAFQDGHEFHGLCRPWLERTVQSANAFGISELALSSVVRIATNPRAVREPATLEQALGFATALLQAPQAVRLRPGARHWDIFVGLCRDTAAKGNVVTDAYFAALAIEHGCEWITLDNDFARFADLKWRRPA